MMPELLPAAFGGLSLGVRSIRHDGGQDWAEHSPTRGSDHTLQPRGKKLARTSCEISFVGSSYLDDHARFSAMADSDEPQIFVHPVRGSYLSVIKDYTYQADESGGGIEAQCLFLEYRPPSPVSLGGSGSLITAGPEAVAVARQRAEAVATSAGVAISSPGAAQATVTRWQQVQIDARTLDLEVSSIVAQIDEEISTLHSWRSWPVIKELVNTRQQVLYAADSIISQTDQIRTITVESPSPLMTIASSLFGGSQARAKAEEIRILNGLAEPGMVRAGTRLRVPA